MWGAAEAGFVLVGPGRRRGRNRRSRADAPTHADVHGAGADDDVPAAGIVSSTLALCRRMASSGFFRRARELARRAVHAAAAADAVAPDARAICLGVGRPACSLNARAQLALFLLLCRELGIESGTACSVYDPQLSAAEREAVLLLGGTCPTRNAIARCPVAPQHVTLVYMPHCGKQLYSNLLAANWTAPQLQRIALLGNRLADYEERTPSALLMAQAPFVRHVLDVVSNMGCLGDYDDAPGAFSDTHMQVFTPDRLAAVPADLWALPTGIRSERDPDVIYTDSADAVDGRCVGYEGKSDT